MALKQGNKHTLGELAEDAFRRDLPLLLKERPGEWVAYHGDRRVGIAGGHGQDRAEQSGAAELQHAALQRQHPRPDRRLAARLQRQRPER